jgi:hypothetical protein
VAIGFLHNIQGGPRRKQSSGTERLKIPCLNNRFAKLSTSCLSIYPCSQGPPYQNRFRNGAVMLPLSGVIVSFHSFQCAILTLRHHAVRSSLRACYEQSATGLVSLFMTHTMDVSSLVPYRGFCLHAHFDISVNGCKSGKRCTYHQLEPGLLGLG